MPHRKLLSDIDQQLALRDFGQALKQKRINAGYKRQTHLATALTEQAGVNVSPQYICQLESAYTGKREKATVPSEMVLDAISSVLNWPKTDIERILGRINENEFMLAATGVSPQEILAHMTPEERIQLIQASGVDMNELVRGMSVREKAEILSTLPPDMAVSVLQSIVSKNN